MSLSASIDPFPKWQHFNIYGIGPKENIFREPVVSLQKNSTLLVKHWGIHLGKTGPSECKDLTPGILDTFRENGLLYAGLASFLNRRPGFATELVKKALQDGTQ